MKRFAKMGGSLGALLALSVFMGVGTLPNPAARADTTVSDAPVASITPADGTTIHKTTFAVPVKVHATSTAGISSITLSGRAGVGTGQFPSAPNSADITITFYPPYYAVGKYAFTTTVTDKTGKQTTKVITLTLVK